MTAARLSTRLNFSHHRACALCWGASREAAPQGGPTDATPVPGGGSAPLADPPASGGRCGTTPDGRAQAGVAGAAPAGTARSAAAATAHAPASATPAVARHRGAQGAPGVAAGAVHRRGAAGLDPRRRVGGGAAAGQSPRPHHTSCRAAGGGAGPALCRGLYTRAGPVAPAPAASTRGADAGALPRARPGGGVEAGRAAPEARGLAGAPGAGVGGDDEGAGGRLQAPSAVAALHGGRGGSGPAVCGGDPGRPAGGRAVGVCPGRVQRAGVR
jgi:hypothetical protein